MKLQRQLSSGSSCISVVIILGPQKKTLLITNHSNPYNVIQSGHFWVFPQPKPLIIHLFHPSFGSPIPPKSIPTYLQIPHIIPVLHLHHFWLQDLPSGHHFFPNTFCPSSYSSPWVPQLKIPAYAPYSTLPCSSTLKYHCCHPPPLFIFSTTTCSHKMQLNLPLCKGIHLFFGSPVCHSFQVFSIVGTGCT